MLRKTNNTLLLWLAIMAGLQNVAGATALSGLLPERWIAGIIIMNGGLQAATAVYVGVAQPIRTPVATKEDMVKGS